MKEYERYNNLSNEQCTMPDSFAVFALEMEGLAWWPLVCDYLDLCDDEHSSLQEKNPPCPVKKSTDLLPSPRLCFYTESSPCKI